MTLKILHFSDLHLDASFAGQGFTKEYGIERRLGLRAMLTTILAKAREHKVNVVTIGGDLFDQDTLVPETLEFLRQQFARLAPIRVIIAPGGHDPYTNESPYARYHWPENVSVYNESKLSPLDLSPDIHLWGASNPPSRGKRLLDNFSSTEGINILLLYTMRGGGNEIHSINLESIKKAGFQIALLGGEHLREPAKTAEPLIVIPGSPDSISPLDGESQHSVGLISINAGKIDFQEIPLHHWQYPVLEVNLNKYSSISELSEHIDEQLGARALKTPHSAITIRLTGKPQFDMDISEIRTAVQTSAFYRLESNIAMPFDLEKLAQEKSVRGHLVQRFLEKINHTTDEDERSQLLTALNFALQALEGKQVNLYETKTT